MPAADRILACGHPYRNHERGKDNCLWCSTCEQGLLSCQHIHQSLDKLCRSEPLAGSFLDRSFSRRVIDIDLQHRRVLAVSPAPQIRAWANRLEQVTAIEAGDSPASHLLQVKRCADAMIGAREQAMLDNIGRTVGELDANEPARRQRAKELSEKDQAPVGPANEGPAPPVSMMDQDRPVSAAGENRANSRPSSRPRLVADTVLSHPATSFDQEEDASTPSSAHRSGSPSAMEVDTANNQDAVTSSRLHRQQEQTSHVSHPSFTSVASITPQKRKPMPEIDGEARNDHTTPVNGRAKNRGHASSTSPHLGRISLPRSTKKAPAPVSEDDKISVADSDADSLIDDSKSHVDRELQRVSSAKLISLYTSLCHEHRTFAIENLRKICRENSFIAYWMQQQLKKSSPRKASELRTPQRPDSAMDGLEETAEDILARFRRPVKQHSAYNPPSRLRQGVAASSHTAMEGVEASSSRTLAASTPSPPPDAPPTKDLPCAAYHADVASWPTETPGTCRYHPGILVWRSLLAHPDSWDKVDPKSRLARKNPELTAWTCCDGNGQSTGCKKGFHPESTNAADTNGEHSAAPLATRSVDSSTLNRQGMEDSITINQRPQPPPAPPAARADEPPSSPPEPTPLSTRDFLAQVSNLTPHVAAPTSTPLSSEEELHNTIWADFPVYARGDGIDRRHRNSRHIIASRHLLYRHGLGCHKCIRRNVDCYYSEVRDKCALCCSQNQSRGSCAKDWPRSGGELVPPNPDLLVKVSKEGAVAAWLESKGEPKKGE